MDLTPRSKVRAMLAALDDDSEEDSPIVKRTSNENILVAPKRASSPSASPPVRNDTSDEDEPIRKAAPKGRTAGRMQAEPEDTPGHLHISESRAYQRIKQQLTTKQPGAVVEPTAPKRTPAAVSTDDDDDDDDDDDEELPIRTIQHRAARTKTRTPSPREAAPSAPSSPGLFLSPDKSPICSAKDIQAGIGASDSDESTTPKRLNPLQALVARKRAERLAKEKAIGEETQHEEEELSRPRKEKAKKTTRVMAESESDEDKSVGKKLTEQARPTRKASKKALEDMNRESQRMSRNMQLTYVAKTKTKVTLDDFMSKFNKSGPTKTLVPVLEENPSSSLHGDDVVDLASTPPSSPPSIGSATAKRATMPVFRMPTRLQLDGDVVEQDNDDEELPSLEEAMKQPVPQIMAANLPRQSPTKQFSLRRLEKSKKRLTRTTSDSEDDLEIIQPAAPSRFAIFDQVPVVKAHESSSMHALRALAQLNGNDRPVRSGKVSMTLGELQVLLGQRAREQADRERNEKIQALRDRGVLVQTAEEKEKDQMQLENMLEKARQEAKELGDKEKADAKKEGKLDEDGSVLPDDDEEDGDWNGSEGDDAVVELSGSEDEEMEEVDDEGEGSQEGLSLLENEAAEDEEEEDAMEVEQEHGADSEEEDVVIGAFSTLSGRPRAARKTIVESEDEDEPVLVDRTPQRPLLHTPKASLAAAFGFAKTTPAPFGLSQMFAGTMADSQGEDDPLPAYNNSQQNSLDFLRSLPEPALFGFSTPRNDTQDNCIQDSQSAVPYAPETQGFGMVQFESQSQMPDATPFFQSQMSDFPELTQDVGIQAIALPSGSRPFGPSASFSTVATLPLGLVEGSQTPAIKKKGHLVRGSKVDRNLTQAHVPLSPTELGSDDEPDNTNDAFAIMRKASTKPAAAEYDKTKSTAKGMVEEQAEESEDEYAGLGGASDDESQGELDEETRKMIDDESNENLNEREVAAFYADKEREDDEKAVEKLYKDIANGGLRRKRGAERGDLWDSDDEDEAAARRRAAKQRDFAKMRKALLADEKIGKIAENPKQQAFFKAIEDLEGEDELDFLDQPELVPSQTLDSQSQLAEVLQPTTANTTKRHDSIAIDSQTMPPPPAPRRSNVYTKPTSLADIRNTLSDLIGQPESMDNNLYFSDCSASDAEDDVNNENDPMDIDNETASPLPETQTHNPRRTVPDVTRNAVIDRIALKRMASSSFSASSDRPAFQSASRASEGSFSFRVPSLLRRVTNASASEQESQGGSMMALGGTGGVKMGGSKKSSVNYYGRGDERKAKMDRLEKERMEEKLRVGRMRREGTGLGGLTGGSWD